MVKLLAVGVSGALSGHSSTTPFSIFRVHGRSKTWRLWPGTVLPSCLCNIARRLGQPSRPWCSRACCWRFCLHSSRLWQRQRLCRGSKRPHANRDSQRGLDPFAILLHSNNRVWPPTCLCRRTARSLPAPALLALPESATMRPAQEFQLLLTYELS